MTAGWCVRVSVFDDLVVSISERELAGRDLSDADQELIRECAQHLLSFVGAAPLPASAALPALIDTLREQLRAVALTGPDYRAAVQTLDELEAALPRADQP